MEKSFTLLQVAMDAAAKACREILTVYHADDFDTELKHDNSPLTLADKISHEVILNHLQSTGIPILSEEGKDIPYDIRKSWEFLWLVDPLDGTKEFLNRNGEFTVNIALIREQQPVLGVVAVPAGGEVYFGGQGIGAFVRRNGADTVLHKRNPVDLKHTGLRIVASRSHLDNDTRAFIESLNNAEVVSRGSSLKFMMLAEGLADVYPRFAPTMEWDTAAAHAIIRQIGIKVINRATRQELHYNKPDLRNPSFLCIPE
ncbi:MAG: 3'(2'),5'-bisphosphate nucleotidase CysQ [Cyclobacteriaceae bacterium]|nr:3'(2'),5'-bisphosphate nucleotidase CysQ [Cyclobacteriaceae bacterium]MCX7638650.1 3'(2'),5'-bisphosphate nucleotidase CysQ [Cyclobacteriaceae bacterium]MDW8332141.1 3'(2'),5'-bisphosphate nucleotidase CysQ [Cyclobacteriaceae bacterium]